MSCAESWGCKHRFCGHVHFFSGTEKGSVPQMLLCAFFLFGTSCQKFDAAPSTDERALGWLAPWQRASNLWVLKLWRSVFKLCIWGNARPLMGFGSWPCVQSSPGIGGDLRRVARHLCAAANTPYCLSGLSVHLSILPSIQPSVHPFIYLVVCLSVCLSVCLFVCVCVKICVCA